MAIGSGAGNEAGADGTRRRIQVVHNDALAEFLLQVGRQDARRNVILITLFPQPICQNEQRPLAHA